VKSDNVWRRRILPAAAGSAAILLAATACGSDDEASASGLTKITVVPSHLSSASNAAVLAGVETGLFKDCGFDVTLKEGGGGGDTIRTVTSGAAQFAFPSVASALPAYLEGNKLAIVGGQALGTNGGAMLVLPDSKLTDPQDLGGKKVGVSAAGSNNATQLDSVVSKLGLKDVEQVAVGEVPAGMAALASGAVDATWATEPDVSQLVKQGKAKVLYKVDDYIEHYQLTLTVTSADYAKENPEIVKSFVDCMDQANKAAEADPDAVGAAFSKAGELGSDEAGIEAVKTNLNPNRYSVAVDVEGVSEVIDEMIDADSLKAGTTISDFKDMFVLPEGSAAEFVGGTP
jgi:NitT/TauT family transport system substrate-binding protein